MTRKAMKTTYIKPNTNIIIAETTLLFGTSGERDVIPTHNDNPQEPGNALGRENKSVWDDDLEEEK